MADPYSFEGPSLTLFFLAESTLHVITYDGQETLIAIEDFLALLIHLSVHQVATLSELEDYSYLRLAARLRRRLQEANG